MYHGPSRQCGYPKPDDLASLKCLLARLTHQSSLIPNGYNSGSILIIKSVLIWEDGGGGAPLGGASCHEYSEMTWKNIPRTCAGHSSARGIVVLKRSNPGEYS